MQHIPTHLLPPVDESPYDRWWKYGYDGLGDEAGMHIEWADIAAKAMESRRRRGRE